jgi:hypothetical protein
MHYARVPRQEGSRNVSPSDAKFADNEQITARRAQETRGKQLDESFQHGSAHRSTP